MLLCRLYALRPINTIILDGSSDDVTKLWSVDPLPKIDKNTTPTTTYLVPGYTFKNKEKGYKQYDRGRSNSPPNNKNKRKNFHNFHNNDNFSKSFSSEHIHQESSSSTTTSTAGSTASKEGLWFRSGIPVAINQEKLKFRHRNKQKLHHSRPMVAHPLGQKKLDSPQVAKFTSQTIPPSSGSESSGYFTPPAEHHLKDPINEQFVQEVDEEEVEEEEETDPPVSSDLIIESSADELPQYQKLQRQSSVISLNEMNEKHLEMGKIIQSQSSHDLTDNGVIVHSYDFVKTKNKSNSEINLKNFLPDIASSSHRKNISSAPPLNDLVPYNFKQTPYVVSTLLPGACIQDDQPSIPLPPPSRGKMNEPIQTNRRLQKRSFFKNPTKSTKMEKIRSYSRSKDALLQAVQQMESIDWEIIMQGLNNLKKLTRHHPDLLETQIHPICVALGKNIKNLRSQVARNACRTASELFANCKKSLEIELEELAVPLLQRTADTNKFLRSDANAALDTMCLHFSIPKVVGVITNKGSNHPNGIVRAATTRLLSEMALRLGAEKIYQLPKEIRDKFLLIGSNGLTEGSLDTRKYAKALMGVMVNHPNFHKALLETVPQTTIRHIAKIINSLKT